MYFLVAWQGDYGERESVSPIVIYDQSPKGGEVVRLFKTRQEGVEFARERLVPDYDYVVVPFFAVAQTAVYRYLQRERKAQIAKMQDDEKKAGCPECLSDYREVGTPRFEDMVCHVKCECNVCHTTYWRVYDPCEVVFDADECGLNLEM